MKRMYALALCLFAFLGAVCQAQIQLPPAEQIGELADLQKRNFFEETIASFNGWDTPFDGGSKVFFFQTVSGQIFYITAGSRHYWNESDKQNMSQPYFIVLEKFYRIEPKSVGEEKLLAMLESALPSLTGTDRRNPQIVRSLIEHIRSRKPVVSRIP